MPDKTAFKTCAVRAYFSRDSICVTVHVVALPGLRLAPVRLTDAPWASHEHWLSTEFILSENVQETSSAKSVSPPYQIWSLMLSY
ncbi:hypothetical protein E2C01_085584 [Portunus trituberculatus]|uniref:Uncharacterized protein n=1 Tax=Portunus trituberculatus TaxID=210409 RepID=A0A5B7J747_PORTR|nr:hypothetical protein [Portunus trituberculatus]